MSEIGRYEVVKALGQGATGTVYLCNDPLYTRDVAIKVYDSFAADSDSERNANLQKMFRTEAAIIGKLTHPNILPIFETGVENDRLFVAMEYVHGARTITSYGSNRNLLPIRNVVEIVSKCAKALNFAHNLGIIHRDVKPGNIMLTTNNDVRVIDFGIAVISDSDLSMIKGLAGSPAYMAPEQIQGGEITHSSDLYSLGVVAYRLLTGHLPFRAKSVVDLLDKIVNSLPIDIEMFRDDVPSDLSKVVSKMIAKDVENRHQTGLEVAVDLSRVYQMMDSSNEDEGDQKQKYRILRKLQFFRDFSATEISELIQIAGWSRFKSGDIVTDNEAGDAQFFIVLNGTVSIMKAGSVLYSLGKDSCFGGKGNDARAKAVAASEVVILRVSAKLLEQMSTQCQLMFNKTFLNALILRLESTNS